MSARHRARRVSGRKPRPARRATICYRIDHAAALGPGESCKFLMPIAGAEEECFAINYGGRLYAYVNRCRHVPIAMDWVENQFFAEQGRYLMCQTHNAYYEPDTGECIAGPQSACGKFLFRIPLEVKDGVVYARPPKHSSGVAD